MIDAEPGVSDAEMERLLEHRLFTSLAVIRTSAELLRENPDMAAEDQCKFLDAVLAEEQRLEEIFAELLRKP